MATNFLPSRVVDTDASSLAIDPTLVDRIYEEEKRRLIDGEHIPYYGLDPAVYDALVSGKLVTFTWMDRPPMDLQGWDFLCRGLKFSPTLSIVNFSGTKFSSLVMFQKLCAALECLRSLMAIDLSDTGLTDDHAEVLAGVLRIRTKVEHLQLPFNRIGPQGAYHLARALATLNSLRTLDLSYNPISDDGLRCIRRSLDIMATYGELEEGVPRHSPLERLYLNGTRLNPDVSGPVLIEMLARMPSLTKLHVPGNDFHSSDSSFYLSEKAKEEHVEVELYMSGTGWQGDQLDSSQPPPPLTPSMRRWLEDREPEED